MNSPPLIASGYAVGLSYLEGFRFRADKPFRACLLCGEVYQTEDDRLELPVSAIGRQAWADGHAKTHSDREHLLLKLSGNSMTPEAANRLAAFGIIPVSDMVLSEEHEAALRESNSMPTDDAEGSV